MAPKNARGLYAPHKNLRSIVVDPETNNRISAYSEEGRRVLAARASNATQPSAVAPRSGSAGRHVTDPPGSRAASPDPRQVAQHLLGAFGLPHRSATNSTASRGHSLAPSRHNTPPPHAPHSSAQSQHSRATSSHRSREQSADSEFVPEQGLDDTQDADFEIDEEYMQQEARDLAETPPRGRPREQPHQETRTKSESREREERVEWKAWTETAEKPMPQFKTTGEDFDYHRTQNEKKRAEQIAEQAKSRNKFLAENRRRAKERREREESLRRQEKELREREANANKPEPPSRRVSPNRPSPQDVEGSEDEDMPKFYNKQTTRPRFKRRTISTDSERSEISGVPTTELLATGGPSSRRVSPIRRRSARQRRRVDEPGSPSPPASSARH